MMEAEPTATEEPPFDGYQPLPRPLLFPNKKSLISDDEDDSEVNSDCSSDSDAPFRKRMKRTFDKSSTKSVNKYDVWAVGLRADNLMDEIGNLNTNSGNRVLDKSRDVESYFEIETPEGCTEEEKKELLASKIKGKVKDRLGKKNQGRQRHQSAPGARSAEKFELRGRSESRSNKNNRAKNNNRNDNNRFSSLSNASSNSSFNGSFESERINVKSRLGKRGKDGIKGRLGPIPDTESCTVAHGTPRELLDLKVTSESEPCDVVQDITNKLYEPKEDLIQRIVDVLGTARSIEIYNETKEVEAKGGMLIMNGIRRRTPGGVYIQLLKKGKIPVEQMKEIFDQDRKVDSKIRRLKAKRRREIKYKRLQKSLSNKKVDCDDDLKPLPTRKEVFESLCRSITKTENADTSVKMEEECETSVKIECENENGHVEHDLTDLDTSIVKTEVEISEENNDCAMEVQPCEEVSKDSGTESEDSAAANDNDIKEVETNENTEDLEDGECLSDSA